MGMSITLDSALRALMASQTGVDTVAHNVANTATPGYTRQRITQVAVPSYAVGGPPRPGQGVQVLSVDRVRDLFIDFQIRSQNEASGRYAAQAESLQRVEMALGEPGEAGLRAAMDQFFNSWRDLSNNPESGPARTSVVQAGQTFGLTAGRVYTSLVELRDESNSRVLGAVSEINNLSSEIARLNDQIVSQTLGGNSAADLRDRRDEALDRLSTLVRVSYVEQQDGRVDISVGGHSLVTGRSSFALEGVVDPLNSNYVDIRFAADGLALNTSGGAARGLLDQRDVDLPSRIADLNALVAVVITDVNATHTAGFGLDGVTGRAFFAGTNASDIAIAAPIQANVNVVAASATLAGVPGDGSNSLAISDLQYARGMLGGTATYDEFYGNFVAGVGVSSREAQSRSRAQDLVLEQLSLAREATAGVNIDEEMVSLVRYQRAYEAASRLISISDEMLDTLINRMAV